MPACKCEKTDLARCTRPFIQLLGDSEARVCKALLRHLSVSLDGFAGKHAREDAKLGDDLAAHVAKLEMSLGLEWRLQHSLLMAIPTMAQVDILTLTCDARILHICVIWQYTAYERGTAQLCKASCATHMHPTMGPNRGLTVVLQTQAGCWTRVKE